MLDLLVHNATLPDGRANMSIAVQDGCIVEVTAGLDAPAAEKLDAKGLLASTAVFVTGEFGRTPKVNKTAGRDHWARAMFVLLGGGGIRGGQVVGASDARGEGPARRCIHQLDRFAQNFFDPAQRG